MTDFSNLTGKFRVYKESSRSESKNATKRPRESLVCNICRQAKLRCDRRQPCSACIRKDAVALCSYDNAQKGSSDTWSTEDRLIHLESLVKGLLQPDSRSSNKITSVGVKELADPRLADETQVEHPGKEFYVGSTHWSAILNDIHELKSALKHHHHESPGASANTMVAESTPHRESIIFGSPEIYSLEQILTQYLPPKEEVDRLLAVYFRGESFIIPFIHTFQFQSQYRTFWDDPGQSNPIWLSILFSICTLSNLIQGKIGALSCHREEVITRTGHFHTAAGKCLVKGEYHRPQPFVLEALTMYTQCKNMQSLDPSRESGVLVAIIVRMAHEMGYHRDPDHLGSLSVFEGEMRRRFWALLKQMDLMISFQLGLPSNICLENCDTKSPRNLTDADFDVETQILPPSRSETEPIGLLWFIVKDRQMIVFSKVCREALSFDKKSESQILELDKEIRRMHTTIPESLRARPIADSIADPPFLIMVRMYVEFIYLKSLCVLHRKYLIQGNTFSTISCTEAGQRLVSQFITMYHEFAPGGQLHQERWMLTNFTMNDFLMGVMVLCLVIQARRHGDSQQPLVNSGTENTILPLLKQAHSICMENSSASRDARYVARAVKAILEEPLDHRPRVTVPESELDWDEAKYLGWLDSFLTEENGLDWGLFESLGLDQEL